jgi:hypothetical protein
VHNKAIMKVDFFIISFEALKTIQKPGVYPR